MFKKVLLILISSILFVLGWWGSEKYFNYLDRNPAQGWSTLSGKPKPLEKYTIENLSQSVAQASKTDFLASKININDNIFDFKVNEKKVTGLVNIPKGDGPFPLAILIRGYVDQSIYQTGTGTKRVGEYFAEKIYLRQGFKHTLQHLHC